MQVRRVRFAHVEGHDDSPVLGIDFYRAHSTDPHERFTEIAHALVALFTLGRDLDGLENGMISVFGEEGAGRVGIVWSRWVHAII